LTSSVKKHGPKFGKFIFTFLKMQQANIKIVSSL